MCMFKRPPMVRILALSSVLLGLSLSAAFARTDQPVPAVAHVAYLPLVLVESSCTRNVYPITFHIRFMEVDPTRVPYPHDPEPMPDPAAEVADIPVSARMQVVRDPNEVSGSGFSWVRWSGDMSSGSAYELVDALTGSGTLWAGFSERTPPPTGYTNGPTLGVLEAGDWVAVKAGLAASLSEPLDYHIANKTLMILPIFDLQSGADNNPEAAFRVARLVQVRLLSYTTQGNRMFLDFGLVQDPYICP